MSGKRTFIQGHSTSAGKDSKKSVIENSYVTSTNNPARDKRGLDAHIMNPELPIIVDLLAQISQQLEGLRFHLQCITGEEDGDNH
jgi:hypothetical protein